MNVLLDMDILAYRASAAVEQTVQWEPGEYGVCSRWCDIDDAVSLVRNMVTNTLDAIKETNEVENVFGCFSVSSDNNYRREIDPEYKMNRNGAARPVGLAATRAALINDEALSDLYEVHIETPLEADDLLGILRVTEDDIMVSDDKDLRTIPGWHAKFATQKAPFSIGFVSEREANKFLLTQCITGDDADGIKGLKGYGPAGAKKLMAKHEDDLEAVWDATVGLYEKQYGEGLGLPKAIQTLRLLYILRSSEDAIEPTTNEPQRLFNNKGVQ